MGPFVAAWLVGEGIIIYRSVKVRKAPPSPGALLLSSGLFVGLALLADVSAARKLAITLAWGFDIAALMNLWGVGGPKAGTTAGRYWPPSLASDNTIFPNSGQTKQGTDTTNSSTGTSNIRQV